MKSSLAAGAAAFVVAAGMAAAAVAQPAQPLSPPSFFVVRPALPESMPTVEPFSDLSPDNVSGTAMHSITATPGCGPANPQGGIPSMMTGTCP